MTVTFVLVTFSATSMYRVSGSSVDLILSVLFLCVGTYYRSSDQLLYYKHNRSNNKLSDEVAGAGLWWWLVGKNQ